ncbi:MAG TPA: patatin-like phospholipase family protein, partial [Acidimicrobiales bacterium]
DDPSPDPDAVPAAATPGAGVAGPVAFVLSSGANLGATQVGMLRALVEHGITPDVVVGCSIGAINGAGLAQDPTTGGVAHMDHVWRTTDTHQLLPRRWLPPTLALARRSESIHPRAGIRHLLSRTLSAVTFDDLRLPFHCVATDVADEREAWFDRGPLVDAVLASAAMPAMFPAVEIDGRRYIDGAVVNEVPVRRAVELGARTIYVLEVGTLTRPRSEPRRPFDAAVQAYWIARRHRYKLELDAVPPHVELHVVPHGEPPSLRVHDFTRSGELIDAAHRAASAYLEGLAAGAAGAVENGAVENGA